MGRDQPQIWVGCSNAVSSGLTKKENKMKGLALYFVLAGVVSGLCGMLWGIQMSISGDHGLSPAHGHLNLLGWVSMTLFGLYYHGVPTAAESGLARVHLVVSLAGLVLIVPGIAVVLSGGTEMLAKIGSLVIVLGMLIFLGVVLRSRQS
jgi:hypothetical protein